MNEIELLKINDFKNTNSENSIYANTILNHLQLHHSRIEKPHKHNFYAVFLFTKGTGIHEIDFNQYKVNPGSVFFLQPGQTHSWELSEEADGFLFFHSTDFYETAYLNHSIKDFPFFESNFTEKHIFLNEEQLKIIQLIFVNLYTETLKQQKKYKQFILTYITQIYIYLNRLHESQNQNNNILLKHYQNVFSNFEKLVDSLFKENKSASKYADLLNITQKHLNRIVQTVTQKTTTQIITDRVILEAKRELLYTNLSLKEIALKLGYTDYTYFSRLFKKHSGIKASDFKKHYNLEE